MKYLLTNSITTTQLYGRWNGIFVCNDILVFGFDDI